MGKRNVDVICQNCVDGRIIPLKVRVIDEDGIPQQFVIKGYREVPAFDSFTMPNEVRISRECIHKKFECKIVVLDRERKIYLTYSKIDMTWIIET